MKRKIVSLIAIVLALLLSGCAAKSADNAAPTEKFDMMMDSKAEMDMEMTTTTSKNSAAGVTDDAGYDVKELADKYGGHKVIMTYEISLETNEFDNSMDAMEEKLIALGGYVLNSRIEGRAPQAYGDRGRYATLAFKIPADKAKEFISAFEGDTYGEVTNFYEYADDVTAAYFDKETRLEVLKTQLDRLQNILVETTNLADIIELEKAIADVMIQIEELTGELRRYDALINYTTIHINMRELPLSAGPVSNKTVGERISTGFSETVHDIGVFFTDAFVWFVSALPILIIEAAAIAVVVIVIRAIVKKNRRKKADGEKNEK